eukprot:g39762.t1
MSVGTLEEIIDDNHAIVSTSVGSEHYVSILSLYRLAQWLALLPHSARDLALIPPLATVCVEFAHGCTGFLPQSKDVQTRARMLRKSVTESMFGLTDVVSSTSGAADIGRTTESLSDLERLFGALDGGERG